MSNMDIRTSEEADLVPTQPKHEKKRRESSVNLNVVPKAPEQDEVVFDQHDIQVRDPFNWMRDINNPKVSKYLKEENAYAKAMMRHTQALQDQLYDEFSGRVGGDDRSPYLQVDNWYYYTRSDVEKEYSVHCRKYDNPDHAMEQVILDENEEAKGEDYYQLGPFEVSPNHNLLAYGTDTEGNERFRVFCKDLSTGLLLEEDIGDVGWTLRWAADNNTFLYTKLDKVTGRAYQLYCHTINENHPEGTDDLLLYEEPDERFVLKINLSNNKKYFLLHIEGQITKEVRYCPTNQPKAGFQPIMGRTEGVQYAVSSHGNYWYIKTNEGGAYNFKVIKVPVSDPMNKDLWETILEHREDVLIKDIELFRHHFVVWEWESGTQKVRIQDLSDGEVHYINFTEPLYCIWPGEVEDQEDTLATRYFNTNRLRFSYTSFLQPTIVYDYDMDNCQKRKVKESFATGFVREDYYQKRIWATTKDGGQIPITLVYKISLRNHQGGNPMLLCGYGAYGELSGPKFSLERLSLLDRGFIYAYCHPRGSAINGWKWYEQGKGLHKMNTFYDFIACAEHLIYEGYTTADQLGIFGRSAGGLLVTAVANLRPDLFKVVLSDVPFCDVIGALGDPKVPWTVYEYDEWGNPYHKDYLKYMLEYSPYHNIGKKNYPHMLITGGINDPRVSFWEPTKYVARLRANKTDTNLLLLKTYHSGHMGASGRYSSFVGTAFQYAFLIHQLGIATGGVYKTKSSLRVVDSVAITPTELLAMFQAFQVTAVISTALKLGLFKELQTRPDYKANAAQLAVALDCDLNALIRILNALTSIGLLSSQRDIFMLTDISLSHLVEGLPGYVGDLCFTLGESAIWNNMKFLTPSVQNGQNQVEGLTMQNHPQQPVSIQKHMAVQLQEVLKPWSAHKKVINVLDLMCGNGIVGHTLAQKKPGTTIVSFESSEMIEQCKKNADEMGIANQVSYIEGDLFETDFKGPYDLIIVGRNCLAYLNKDDAQKLMQKILDSLKPTGRVVLTETIKMEFDDSQSQLYANLLSVAMLVTTQSGKVHSNEWYNKVLEAAGFGVPQIYDLKPFPEKLLVCHSNIISQRVVKQG